jgi:thiopeptide-type bacteriocin biosynthesis protein
MRIRFATGGDRWLRVRADLQDRIDAWRRDGLIDSWQHGVYEPEAYLFGGPVSMRSVHHVFTADSLAWLDYHVLAWNRRADVPSPGPSWAMSLVLIRELFDALGIVGWEDLDVWDRLRWQTGRSLGTGATGDDGIEKLAKALRRGWSDPEELLNLLAPRTREIADEARRSIEAEGPRWLADYFTTSHAVVGPREIAAYLIVFHWNRAGLPITRQSLIAEALAARTTESDR